MLEAGSGAYAVPVTVAVVAVLVPVVVPAAAALAPGEPVMAPCQLLVTVARKTTAGS